MKARRRTAECEAIDLASRAGRQQGEGAGRWERGGLFSLAHLTGVCILYSIHAKALRVVGSPPYCSPVIELRKISVLIVAE